MPRADYRKDSELMRLCSGRRPRARWGWGMIFYTLLSESQKLSELSGGTFDCTVGALCAALAQGPQG